MSEKKLDKLLRPDALQKADNQQLDKLSRPEGTGDSLPLRKAAGLLMQSDELGGSPALRKAADMWMQIDEIYSTLAEIREDCERIKCEDERRETLQRAMQKFLQDAPINGAYHS